MGILSVASAEADLVQPHVHGLADLVLALVRVLAQREGGVVEDVHRAEQRAVLEQQPELLAHLEELVVGHVGDGFAVNEHVSGIGIQQPDDVLDQDALARARRPEDHRDLIVGEAEIESVEDSRAPELLDHVDDLDRILATVVALLAGVPDVGIGLVFVDARDRVVLVQAAELGSRLLVGLPVPGGGVARRIVGRGRRLLGRLALVAGSVFVVALVAGSFVGHQFSPCSPPSRRLALADWLPRRQAFPSFR